MIAAIIVSFALGALFGALVAKNNQRKTFAVLDSLRKDAEDALAAAKAELANLKNHETPSTPQA